MGIKRHKPEEIVTKLRQVEVLCGQRMPHVDAIRQVQITEQTFYRWLSAQRATWRAKCYTQIGFIAYWNGRRLDQHADNSASSAWKFWGGQRSIPKVL